MQSSLAVSYRFDTRDTVPTYCANTLLSLTGVVIFIVAYHYIVSKVKRIGASGEQNKYHKGNH